jgi:5-formyltetrahydrofolate cyclo-ligase
MDIKSLRREIRKQRQALSAKLQQQFSATICQKIIANTIFQRSQKIAFYYPQNGEVDTLQLQKLYPQKEYYLPILNPDCSCNLFFAHYVNAAALINNKFGIPEPDLLSAQFINAEDLDLVIAPLVLFDENCNRVGMGAGYYDRTFAFKRDSISRQPFLLGVAYEFQKVPILTANPWDVKLQMVVTEKNIYIE